MGFNKLESKTTWIIGKKQFSGGGGEEGRFEIIFVIENVVDVVLVSQAFWGFIVVRPPPFFL